MNRLRTPLPHLPNPFSCRTSASSDKYMWDRFALEMTDERRVGWGGWGESSNCAGTLHGKHEAIFYREPWDGQMGEFPDVTCWLSCNPYWYHVEGIAGTDG